MRSAARTVPPAVDVVRATVSPEPSGKGQVAAASYLRPQGATVFQLAALDVLRIEDGQIAETRRG